MIKILVNTTASAIFVTDTGISIPALSNYTIPPQDYPLWAASSDVITYVGDASLVVNDSIQDLSKADGISLIQSNFKQLDFIPDLKASNRLKVDISGLSSDNVIEGATNLFFTDERAQDAVGSALTDTSSVDLTYNDAGNTISASVLPAGVDHNQLQNFVANKHVDHSAVNITAGTGLSGGGDITATRTLNIANTTVAAGSYGSATQVSSLTVNAQGQLTSASSTSIAIPSSQVTDFSTAADARISAQKGQNNGLATLDGAGKIPTAQLPSYVDDVLEYANLAAFPVTGSAGIIYVALDTNKAYRWSGTVYIEVSPSDVNSVFGRTGVVAAQAGDYTATQITNTPAGNIAAITVQAALNELDAEKQPLDGDLTAIAALSTTGLITRTAANTVTTRSVAAGTGISVTNGDGVSGNPTVSLANTAVAAGTYGSATQVAQVTLDAQGRATSASNVTIAIPSTQVTDFAEAAQDAVSGIFDSTPSVSVVYDDVGGALTATVLPAGVDHNSLANLSSGDVHTQYALLSGRSGGQSLIGGTAASNNLTLSSTSNATKGKLLVGTSAYDEVNNRLGIGTSSPSQALTVNGNIQVTSATGFISLDAASNATPPASLVNGLYSTTNGLTTYSSVGSVSFWLNNAGTGYEAGYFKNFSGTPRMVVGKDSDTLASTDTFGTLNVFTTSTSDDRGLTTMQFSSDNTSAKTIFAKSRGTPAAKTQVLANDFIGAFDMRSWDGTSWGQNVFISAKAVENQTATTRGAEIQFYTVTAGTNTIGSPKLIVGSTDFNTMSGGLVLGNSTSTTSGLIDYTGSDFLGINAGVPKSLTKINSIELTSATSVSTTSTTFANLSGISTTPAAGKYLVVVNAGYQVLTDSAGEIAIFVGGTKQTVSTRVISAAASGATTTNASATVSTMLLVTVNGSQAINIRYRATTGTLTITNRGIWLVESV